MNAPSAIHSQQAKWMEVILAWLGIFIPFQFGPVVYQDFHWSQATPIFVINGLGTFCILAISLTLLLKYRTLAHWILNTPSPSPAVSRQLAEFSGWLTIGIFLCGLLAFVHTISIMCFSLSSRFSPWFTVNQGTFEIPKEQIWFDLSLMGLNYLPQTIGALVFIFFAQAMATLAMYLPKHWSSHETETPIS